MAVAYRTLLAQQGMSAAPLYSGDPGFREQVQILMNAAGTGPVNDSGPTQAIPGATIPKPAVEVLPNTAVITPTGNVQTSPGLSLKGAVQWVKDNPGKAVAIGFAAALVLHELFGKKK